MKKNKKILKPIICAVLFVIGFYYSCGHIHGLKFLTLKSEAVLEKIKLKNKIPPIQAGDITIVAVDSDSLRLLEQNFPISRDIYASLLNVLRDKEPAVVAFDIAFPNRDAEDFDADRLFHMAVKSSENVVLPSFMTRQKSLVLPHELFYSVSAAVGHLNKPLSVDRAVRKSTSFLSFDKSASHKLRTSFSFEMQVLRHYFGVKPEDVKVVPQQEISFVSSKGKSITIPLDDRNRYRINYQMHPAMFNVVPLYKMLKGIVPKSYFYGRIVLVGVVEEIFHDMYDTPIGNIAGIMINANSILTVLSQNFILALDARIYVSILVLFTILVVFISLRFRIFFGFLFSLIAAGLFSYMSYYLLLNKNIMCSPFPFLGASFCIVIFLSIYRYIILKLEKHYFEKLAITDGLTGLYIHRYLMLRLGEEFERSARSGQSFSFLITDIDHFKGFNDTYGHEIGNDVLKMFASVMNETFRKVDFLARYGGEEFCVILPGVGSEGAYESAERFRKALESSPIPTLPDVKVTVSIGIATAVEMPEVADPDTLIKLADEAMYYSKENGRNRCTVYKKGL